MTLFILAGTMYILLVPTTATRKDFVLYAVIAVMLLTLAFLQ